MKNRLIIYFKKNYWNCISAFISVLMLFAMYSIANKQQQYLDRGTKINQLLIEAEKEFNHNNFEKAFELYSKVKNDFNTLDPTGYYKFIDKAIEQKSKYEDCNDDIIRYLNYAKQLQNTTVVNDWLNKCNTMNK